LGDDDVDSELNQFLRERREPIGFQLLGAGMTLMKLPLLPWFVPVLAMLALAVTIICIWRTSPKWAERRTQTLPGQSDHSKGPR